jgi:hypothetical protein
MQFRLSTLFLIFFMVATSLALYCPLGVWFIAIWIDAIILLSALLLNRFKNLSNAVVCVVFLIFLGIICPGLPPAISPAREAARRAQCINNLKQIGLALQNYHDVNKHFPPVYKCDENGKPLFCWRVEIMPMMGYGSLYDSLKKDEPWNSANNAKVLCQYFPDYKCPSDNRGKNYFSTNYIAIIGPGAVWRKDGPVKLSDLPDGGSHTVMAIEVVNSGMHWAEPRDLTVEEAMEGIKTGKGLRISSYHPNIINVLFADGTVRSIPSKMPISLWKKLLAGEMQNLEDPNVDESAPDMVDVSVVPPDITPGKWTILLGLIVWLFSIALLFRRAVKSRRKPVTAA